jgi:hypothetical protein
MKKKKTFRDGTVNLVFSSLDELLAGFERNNPGGWEFRRIPGRQPYSSVVKQANPTTKGTVVYLVETEGSPEGTEFFYLDTSLIRGILSSYDTVLQLVRMEFDGGRLADGIGEHKVYGHVNSQF